MSLKEILTQPCVCSALVLALRSGIGYCQALGVVCVLGKKYGVCEVINGAL